MNSKKNFLILPVIFLYTSFIWGQSWALPKDNNGWSVLTPSDDSRIIYVSESEGNDTLGEIYDISQVGTNLRSPSISVKPYKTIEAGLDQMRDGYPDWLLLKQGDTWENEGIALRYRGSGRGLDERSVITYYGTTGDRPLIKNGSIQANHGVFNQYWAIVGLGFYASYVDPNSADYDSSTTSSSSINLISGGKDILFEDCRLHFVELIIQGYDSTYHNIELRRNIITDAYYKSSCSDKTNRPSTVFMHNIENYLIEENTVDYCGWNPDIPGAGQNQYNHGFYLQHSNSGDLIFKGNIMTRASANGVQNRSGGRIENNLAIQCPIGISVSHDTTHGAGAKNGITYAKNNVITEGLYMGDCTWATGANWGLDLNTSLEDSTLIEGNIITHNIDKTGVVRGITNKPEQCKYSDNIVYDWKDSEDMWDDNWRDPERTIASYNESIGGEATTDAFIESIRNRKLHEWPKELSALAVINYIREGFSMEEISSTKEIEQQPAELSVIQNYPNPFNAVTTIKYSVQNAGNVVLKVYNITGNEVETLVNKNQMPGEYSITFDGSNIDGGIYFCVFSINKVPVSSNKLVLIK